jgi:hypothetical protein
LVLGLILWTGMAVNVVSLHMLLGLLTVVALWVVGVAQALAPGGSWGLAAGAIVLGALTAWLGMVQASLLVSENHSSDPSATGHRDHRPGSHGRRASAQTRGSLTSPLDLARSLLDLEPRRACSFKSAISPLWF